MHTGDYIHTAVPQLQKEITEPNEMGRTKQRLQKQHRGPSEMVTPTDPGYCQRNPKNPRDAGIPDQERDCERKANTRSDTPEPTVLPNKQRFQKGNKQSKGTRRQPYDPRIPTKEMKLQALKAPHPEDEDYDIDVTDSEEDVREHLDPHPELGIQYEPKRQ